MLRADRAQIDRPVSPAADVVDLSSRSTANLASSSEQLGVGLLRYEANPQREPAAEDTPKLLAEGDLPIRVEDLVLRDCSSELPNKPGDFPAFAAAVGAAAAAHRRSAI